ncbi:hypothetical protein LCGC14_1005930 [marine sediment metagenome]|uniref:DNA methylase N-4/N-6 domain-containing protein n=1 Tax=marine sediment metagenome TaxID=412755 RepID=A0A0F9N6C6_9ZZZZ
MSLNLKTLNNVILGDCLEKMKDIPDNSIDMILTDLPYGVTARNKWDSIIQFDELWKQWNRIKKDTSPVVLTAIQPFSSISVLSNIIDFKYEWIWRKSTITGVLNAKRQPVRNNEQVLVFYKKQCMYNPQGLIEVNQITKQGTSSKNYGSRDENSSYKQQFTNYPRSVLEVKSTSTRSHPTEKPVALFEYLIKTYTDEDMTVLDCCAGSGTTAIACMNTNRNYICIEKDEQYIEVIRQRISRHR